MSHVPSTPQTPVTPGLTHALTAFAKGVRWAELDAGTQAAAQRHLTDTLGVMLAGSTQTLTTRAAAGLAAVRPAGGTVPVLGHSRRWDLLDAAYLGAAAGHGLELDDGYRAGSAHPGVVVIPAALAVACERSNRGQAVSGQQLLEAVVAGYEAMTVIARLAHPAMRHRGFHPTATAGVFGAAVAAAHLRQLPLPQWQHAIGLAASSASGLFAFVAGGADVKRLHPGHAAREGVMAVLFAEQGLEGPPSVLEGKDGFLQAFAGLPHNAQACTDATSDWPPSRPWGIADCYLKPWPCCRHLHPAVDALLHLKETHQLQAHEVDRIEVETYSIAAEHAEVGWADFASSQLSFPFVMATALRFGNVTLSHFGDEARQDPQTQALCTRLSVSASAEMDERYRSERPSRITVSARGQRWVCDRTDALGAPSMPMSAAQLERKFIDHLPPNMSPAVAQAWYDAAQSLVTVADVGKLVNQLQTP